MTLLRMARSLASRPASFRARNSDADGALSSETNVSSRNCAGTSACAMAALNSRSAEGASRSTNSAIHLRYERRTAGCGPIADDNALNAVSSVRCCSSIHCRMAQSSRTSCAVATSKALVSGETTRESCLRRAMAAALSPVAGT
ncbi:hypothetical protein D3C85_1406540 [compost metagenome]